MKLTIDQVHFLSEAVNSINIPAKQARNLVAIQDVLEKEFLRLQKAPTKEALAK
jgi:hypothetical protein